MVREEPAPIATEVAALRGATDRPFAVNLTPAATEPWLLNPQIDCSLDFGVPVFSFFWDVMPDVDRQQRDRRAGRALPGAMALYAGQGAGALNDVPPAATRLGDMVAQARHILKDTVRNDFKAMS